VDFFFFLLFFFFVCKWVLSLSIVAVKGLDELLLVRIHPDLSSEVLAGLAVLLLADDVLALLADELAGLLLGDTGFLLVDAQVLADELAAAQRLGVWVELDHEAEVAQRVLLVHDVLLLVLLGAKVRLDLLRVDEAAKIRVRDDRARKSIAKFER